MLPEENKCWILGRKAVLPNGHEHVVEPFIVFHDLMQAESARDLVKKVSGETPMIVEASFWR